MLAQCYPPQPKCMSQDLASLEFFTANLLQGLNASVKGGLDTSQMFVINQR